MDYFSKLIATEQATEQSCKFVRMYSEPKIYHGGKNYDLSKRWYVYFSYRNPKTGKMEKSKNYYHRANQLFQNKEDRLVYLKELQRVIKSLLKKGYSPYDIEVKAIGTANNQLDFALEQKRKLIKETTFADYKNRLSHFKVYLDSKGLLDLSIDNIKRKDVNEFLNQVLSKSGARNRNNTRMVISSLFSVLEQNEIIELNYIKSIKPLRTLPTRHKTFSSDLVGKIFNFLETKNPQLLLYIKFVSYGFLRPIEVCRLKIEDIDFQSNTLTVRAKNKALKTKKIPSILVNDIQHLKELNPKQWIFTPEGVSGSDTAEINRRDYFSKQFLKVKKEFNLGADHTLYSFRHTFVTKVYRELRKNKSPFEAKSDLMLITGHSTMSALEKYLRDIDAELPEDFSKYLY